MGAQFKKKTRLIDTFFRSKDYKKVPIATIDNKHYFGSDTIRNALLENESVQERLLNKSASMNLDEFRNSSLAVKWQEFATQELAPLLYPNMCGTLRDAYQAFQYVNDLPQFGVVQKMAIKSIGSLAMYAAASRVKSK
jgi:microsomal prostaglandin-E synthase 2